MHEKIINYIKDNPYCKLGDLCSIYDGRKNELMNLINNLIVEGDIIEEDNTYLTPYNLGLIKARIVSVKHHYAFANIADTDEDVREPGQRIPGGLHCPEFRPGYPG